VQFGKPVVVGMLGSSRVEVRPEHDAREPMRRDPDRSTGRSHHAAVEADIGIDEGLRVTAAASGVSLPHRKHEVAHAGRRRALSGDASHRRVDDDSEVANLPSRGAKSCRLQGPRRTWAADDETADPMTDLNETFALQLGDRFSYRGETRTQLGGKAPQ
jgi:hypothetical protein